jgi:two-component system cell cycle sensor histidine kinase/response regulator CckA
MRVTLRSFERGGRLDRHRALRSRRDDGFGARPRSSVVLNVDDSDERLLFRTTVLKASHFDVLEARTGTQALQMAAERQPSLVLLDVKLPDVDGIEVCRRLKADPATEAIPVLHVSAAFPDDEHRVKALQVGAESYLAEPVSPDVLIEVIRSLLRRAGFEADARRARSTAEEARRTSEQRYRSLFEHAPYGISQTTPDGRFLAANRALAQMLGYRSSQELLAVGDILGFYVDPDERSRLMERIRRQEAIKGVEVLWKRRDGQPIRVRVSSRRIAEGFETFVEDVTARQSLEEQLRQSQKLEAIGRLAGGVAHDFNNSLTVILGYADMLVNQLGLDKPIGRDLNEIRKSAEHAASLTHQLLTFSRQQPVEIAVLDLNIVVRDALRMLERLIGEHVAVRLTTTPRACPVRADAAQLQQVLINLGVNARDAMPDGGNLNIETEAVEVDVQFAFAHPPLLPGRYVRLTVRDTGVGMDATTQDQIFEPFFTTKEVGKGTGLGLSTVYGIVKQIGGHVFVTSSINRGTQFDLYFPETAEMPADDVRHREVTDLAVGSGTVLVVEDQPNVRALAVAALKRHGYQVVEAEGSEHALGLSDEVLMSVDVLLTDIVMPFMSGRALAARLRERRPALRVLFMSGFGGRDVDRRETDRPVLRKPFTTPALLAAVKGALGSRD